MTQTPSSGNGAMPEPGSPATGTPPGSGETPPAQLPQSIDDALKQVEDLRAALKKANAESASHRHKLKTFEDAQLSETEKMQKELADLKAAREADVEDRIADKIRLAAAAMGFNKKIVQRIPGMLDWADLDIDEKTGMPTNIDKLLKGLKDEFQDVPGFFGDGRSTPTSGGATNPSRSSSNQIGEITMDNLTQAMADYNSLSASQKERVHQLLINRI